METAQSVAICLVCSPDWSSAGCDSSYNDHRDSKSSQRQLVSKNKMQTAQGLFLLLQCSLSEGNELLT